MDWSPILESRLITGIEMQIHSSMGERGNNVQKLIMLMELCIVSIPVTTVTSLFSTASAKGFFFKSLHAKRQHKGSCG